MLPLNLWSYSLIKIPKKWIFEKIEQRREVWVAFQLQHLSKFPSFFFSLKKSVNQLFQIQNCYAWQTFYCLLMMVFTDWFIHFVLIGRKMSPSSHFSAEYYFISLIMCVIKCLLIIFGFDGFPSEHHRECTDKWSLLGISYKRGTTLRKFWWF